MSWQFDLVDKPISPPSLQVLFKQECMANKLDIIKEGTVHLEEGGTMFIQDWIISAISDDVYHRTLTRIADIVRSKYIERGKFYSD